MIDRTVMAVLFCSVPGAVNWFSRDTDNNISMYEYVYVWITSADDAQFCSPFE